MAFMMVEKEKERCIDKFTMEIKFSCISGQCERILCTLMAERRDAGAGSRIGQGWQAIVQSHIERKQGCEYV